MPPARVKQRWGDVAIFCENKVWGRPDRRRADVPSLRLLSWHSSVSPPSGGISRENTKPGGDKGRAGGANRSTETRPDGREEDESLFGSWQEQRCGFGGGGGVSCGKRSVFRVDSQTHENTIFQIYWPRFSKTWCLWTHNHFKPKFRV